MYKCGYVVKTKVGGIAGDSYKCDFDVEMTLDISRVAYESKPDIVVLVSGDKDFIPIVLELRNKGIRVEVAAFSIAMARELALKSSDYINLDVLIQDETDAPTEEPSNDENEGVMPDADGEN